MKLIGSLTSPYVRKTRIVLVEKKIEYEFVLEDVRSPSPTFHELNPLGKIPCLVMEDGKAIYDSSVIVDYLDTMTPVGKLLPATARERAEVKCYEALADGILDAAVLAYLEKHRRKPEEQSKDWMDFQNQKALTGLKALSAHLGNKSFFFDNRYTLADIAVGCALGWLSFRCPEIEWEKEYKNLANFYTRLSERQSFQLTEPKE